MMRICCGAIVMAVFSVACSETIVFTGGDAATDSSESEARVQLEDLEGGDTGLTADVTDVVLVPDGVLSDLPAAQDTSEMGIQDSSGVELVDELSDVGLPDQLPVDAESAGDLSPEVAQPDVVLPDVPSPEPLPYPERNAYQIKGLQPDYWPNHDEIAGNKTGGVAMNLVWHGWEGENKAPPCGVGEQEYDGHCFAISDGVNNDIKDWTDRGLVVTGILWGVPAWARQQVDCSPVTGGFEVFCKPDDPADFARFAGMLAKRFNGLNGNGRVADFVIHNEVNSNDWFDIGCGQGKACDADDWVQAYADNYNLAYDAIKAEQPHAKVLISYTHHFDVEFDKPSAQNPTMSVKTFTTKLAPLLGAREWRIAYHPYAPNLLSPVFSADDLPKVTYGNLGVLVGWLLQTFPNDPHAWDVQLTESGINSLAPQSSPAAQADAVCRTFVNVLGTPYISNYIYHRMKDHAVEVAGGIGLGLATETGDFKPSWTTWALANRWDLDPPQLSCGFEHIPYTRLVRGKHPTRGHWASTRILPDGFVEEQVYYLWREQQPGTTMLFECRQGDDNFVSKASNCEGQLNMGPLGFIFDESQDGTVPLYRCYNELDDHMISPAANCEGWTTESLLGYAVK